MDQPSDALRFSSVLLANWLWGLLACGEEEAEVPYQGMPSGSHFFTLKV